MKTFPKNGRLRSMLQISNIQANKQFCRLSEKTQVAFPRQGQPEVVRNRLTHSYEVATSAEIMALHIDEQLGWPEGTTDYMGSITPCSLLHDIGHPPLGHSGATFLDNFFKSRGLEEGFSDNNNTLVVVDKNNIMVDKHTIASVIKYPEALYPWQRQDYLSALQDALKIDSKHFEKHGLSLLDQTRTVACQIMDEADRNTYICSDLSDFLCLGNTLSIDVLKSRSHRVNLMYRYTELQILFSILRDGDKSAIKAYFNNLKNQFNMNYTLSGSGLTVVNQDLHEYREFLWDLEFEFYIRPIRKEPFHANNMARLKEYVLRVVDDGFTPSRYYAAKIDEARGAGDNEAIMRAQRDMIAETTDWYVTQIHKHAQSADTIPSSSLTDGGLFATNQPESMIRES